MRIPRLPTRPWVAAAAVVAAAAILIAAGVGSTHATEPDNPQIAENSPAGTAVGTPMSATVGSGTVRYALSGPDAANFNINPDTGEVKLAEGASVDYEQQDSYAITVTATADVTVAVDNAPESGVITLSNNEPRSGETITATIDDPDGGVHSATYRWSRSVPGGWEVITGEMRDSYTVTAEDIGSYISVSVTYHDNAGSGSAVWRTTHTVKNNPPVFPHSSATRQVDENSPPGTAVGEPVTATDPDATNVTYSLTGDDNFAVDQQSGQITVASGALLDHEAQREHVVNVKATDANGGTDHVAVSITVGNIDEAGTVSLSHGALTPGATISAAISDPDGEVSNASWQWQRSSDQIHNAMSASYTATSDDVGHSLTATVNYTDGHGPGKSADATTTSAVANDTPIFSETTPQRAIDENSPAGTYVGAAVAATDANGDDITYSLDDANFAVDQAGNISSTAVLDHEEASSHSVQVTATDEHGAATTVTVIISVNNLDKAGAVALNIDSPKVGDTVIAALSDPDGATSAESWQWQNGDGSTWTDIINADSAAYTVQADDIGQLIRSNVAYTDPQGPGKSAAAQTANTVSNDPPVFGTTDPLNLSIDENNATSDSIGAPLAATDPNGDDLTFSLEGADAAQFNVDQNGQITIIASLDHETHPAYSFTARVSDPAGGSDTITVAVSVENVEEAGTVTLSPSGTPEVNTAITASLDDPDGSVTGETWQWQSGDSNTGPWTDIADANGTSYAPTGDDIDQFLRTTVSYADGHGTGTDTAYGVTEAVQPEPNRPPAFDPATTTFNISINVRESVRVAPPFSATDPNGDTLTYSITVDQQNAFTINAATGEVLMGSADMTVDTTYTATINVTDGLDDERNTDHSADDSLSLSMTMVNPNIVVNPVSNRSFPYGLWVADDIVVTTNDGSSEDWTLFYNRDTQAELEDRNFEITKPKFAAPRGVWSNGDTVYLLVLNDGSSSRKGKIYGYSLASGTRQSSQDIALANANRHPTGLTGHDGKLYVGDNADSKVYAYDIATRAHSADDDIGSIDRLGKQMTDVWRNADTIWISYWRSDFIRAYDTETGTRKAGLDIQTATDNRGPTGIDSDGFNLWALDQVNDTIYGYVVPQ